MKDYFTEEVIKIQELVREDPAYSELSDEKLKERIDSILEGRIRKCEKEEADIAGYYSSISFKERRKIGDTVFKSIRGLGILDKIIEDDTITEVMINGYDNIFVEKNGRIQRLPDKFESPEKLKSIITKFVQDMGRSISESNPIVDTRLKDGSRVNVVSDPIALNGPIVTIRRFPEEGMTVQRLISYKSITPEAAIFLEKLVKAKYNIFISGGTGSGKTTFLNALSNYIPSDERVITIEDSAELQIRNIPNLVRLETRNANATGAGAVTIRDLIKASLRMRPERIVVGEVRGAEALDMLQAMNTGHDGSLSTGHANSPHDIISRIETMVLQGQDFPLNAIRQQIASGIDIIVQLGRLRDKSRRVLEISEVDGFMDGEIVLHTLYRFEETAVLDSGRIQGFLKKEGTLCHTDKLMAAGLSV